MEWKENKLVSATIRSINGTETKVRYGDKIIDLQLKPGQVKKLEADLEE
ncbi:hypothetical protein [Botryobacter ruber]|nr:hypothetical protein [Botryobacter ruber]